jgi:endonuclease-3
VLSAQCTDTNVNNVTKNIYNKYYTPQHFVDLKINKITKLINSIGLFNTKAKSLYYLSKILIEKHNGKVPDNFEELILLPGVGRKTANVVLGHAFGIPGITVDTHFGRLSRRFGWSKQNNPVKVEFEVGELIPKEEWTNLSQRMIWHGRRVCHSRKPACGACALAKLCPSYGIGEVDPVKAKRMVKVEADFR